MQPPTCGAQRESAVAVKYDDRSSIPFRHRRTLDNTTTNNNNRTSDDDLDKITIQSPQMYVLDLSERDKFECKSPCRPPVPTHIAAYVKTLSVHSPCTLCVHPLLFTVIILTNLSTLGIATVLAVRCARHPLKLAV